MVALSDAKSAQTLYALLRGLEKKNHLGVTITSYGQAVPNQDDAQRSYTFPQLIQPRPWSMCSGRLTRTPCRATSSGPERTLPRAACVVDLGIPPVLVLNPKNSFILY